MRLAILEHEGPDRRLRGELRVGDSGEGPRILQYVRVHIAWEHTSGRTVHTGLVGTLVILYFQYTR